MNQFPLQAVMEIVEIFYWFVKAVLALLFLALCIRLVYKLLNWLTKSRTRPFDDV